jgi:hypothetical protein
VTDSSDDLRILDEMASEIEENNCTGLRGALRCNLKTKRARRVGRVLETTAMYLLTSNYELKEVRDHLLLVIEGLRTDNQRLTDALLEATATP